MTAPMLILIAGPYRSGTGAGAAAPPDEVLCPAAERLLQHCDAVLRLPGASTGADRDVEIAQQRGIPVYERVDQIPGYRS